jgi:hypothetical protein
MREGSIAGLKIGRTRLVRRQALDSYIKRTSKIAKHDPVGNKVPDAPTGGILFLK